jgi:hypothetical protein
MERNRKFVTHIELVQAFQGIMCNNGRIGQFYRQAQQPGFDLCNNAYVTRYSILNVRDRVVLIIRHGG